MGSSAAKGSSMHGSASDAGVSVIFSSGMGCSSVKRSWIDDSSTDVGFSADFSSIAGSLAMVLLDTPPARPGCSMMPICFVAGSGTFPDSVISAMGSTPAPFEDMSSKIGSSAEKLC